ncbi:MFS transporter [Lysinibacillus endophyticus]|uniref:MFS transporter n=1 Tax=Ureibacillus endophyticus TaxID=1978490 RepID=A0A494Z9F4_9BACL|nr:MFS transporter [Lysinibacillus endophyticus]MCP1145383.1 MFS transporter [Lysinibacillus endophyticus]RKQ19207.1 MFS transporter [Lysinibacillus endophyticus]
MNNQRWLSQSYFIFFFTWGVYLQYWSGWLSEAKGLTASQVGYIMGIGLIARAVATMFAFPFATKFLSGKKLILVLVVASLVVTLLYLPANSFETILMITFLFSLNYPALLPAIENSATTLMQTSQINYGKSRSYGSIGFVIAVLIISFIVGIAGERAILWCMIAFLSIMLLMQTLPTPAVLLVKPTAEDRGKSSSMIGLFKIKGFSIILLVVVLLQGSMASYYNYSYLYLQQYLDVNPLYIGIILNIAVISEIIYLLKADRFGHWKTSKLLIVAGIASTVRWIMIFVFPNVWAFIISQTLHSLSFAMAHFAFIQYISKTLPKQQLSNAQGVYSALGMSLSAALLTLFGGFLYEIQPGLSFLGMIVFTIPAVLIIYATRKKYQY